MKTVIAITLIITGALLVITPALADILYQRNVVELLSQATVNTVALSGQMSEIYRFGCWLTGTGMIGIAVLCSLSARRSIDEPAGLAANRG